MLKKKFKLIAILLIAVLLMFSCYSVFADNEESTENESNNESVASDNFKKEDLYLNDSNIVIDTMVDGNVFAIGNKVTISSEIGGDAFIMAKEVIVEKSGYINGNLFVVSDNLNLSGLANDVYSASKTVTISGFIYRDLKVIGNSLNIYGTVGRNAVSGTSNINFKDESNEATTQGLITGNLNYYGPDETISNGSENVSGDVSFTKVTPQTKTKGFMDYLFSLICSIVFIAIIWLLSKIFATKFSNRAGKVLLSKPIVSVLLGILSLIFIPILSIILIFLRITATVGILIFALYLLLLAISSSIFTISINDIVCNKFKVSNTSRKLLYLVIVSTVIWLLKLIPTFGTILTFISVIIGLGILVTYLINKNKDFSPKSTEKINVA